ncbi:hypothetical protein U9M48_002660, partial [Paspalum notatum var. saurae]
PSPRRGKGSRLASRAPWLPSAYPSCPDLPPAEPCARRPSGCAARRPPLPRRPSSASPRLRPGPRRPLFASSTSHSRAARTARVCGSALLRLGLAGSGLGDPARLRRPAAGLPTRRGHARPLDPRQPRASASPAQASLPRRPRAAAPVRPRPPRPAVPHGPARPLVDLCRPAPLRLCLAGSLIPRLTQAVSSRPQVLSFSLFKKLKCSTQIPELRQHGIRQQQKGKKKSNRIWKRSEELL